MTTVEGFVGFIQILISLAVLIWFFAGPWPSFRVDTSRQRCFELRDRLFLFAADSGVDFDDPLYRRTREWLNACIAHAHDMKLWNLMAFIFAHRPGPRSNLYTDIRALPDGPVRTELSEIVEQAMFVQIELMVARSPLLLAVTILTPLFVLAGLMTDRAQALYLRARPWILSYDDPGRSKPETGAAGAPA